MNEGTRLVKNTLIISIGNVSTKLITFLLLPLYTTLLSPADYGIFDYTLNLSLFAIPVVTLVMDESMFRFLIDCETEEEKKRVISASCITQISGVIIFIILGSMFFQLYQYKFGYYMLAYIAACSSTSIINPILRGQGKFVSYTLYNAALSFSVAVFDIILVAIFRYGIEGLFIGHIAAHIVVSSITFIIIKIWKYINIDCINWKLIKGMLLYSLPLIPHKLSSMIINLSDRIIIMNILGSASAGIYAISTKIPTIMSTFYSFFYTSWQESAARIVTNKDSVGFYNYIYIKLRRILLSIALFLCAFIPIIFRVLINQQYYSAIKYVPILLLATYYSSISSFYGGIFTAYKSTKIMGTTTLIAAIINIISNLGLIYFCGIYAGAISSFIANFVVCSYRKMLLKDYIKLKDEYLIIIWGTILWGVSYISLLGNIGILQIISCVFIVIFSVIVNWEILRQIVIRMKIKDVN